MAIITNSNQYRYTGKGPLDSKALIKTYAELLKEETWYASATNTASCAYNGMIVAVWLNKEDTSKNGIYFLFDPAVTSALGKPVVTKEENWHKLAELSDLANVDTSEISAQIAELTTKVTTVEEAINGKEGQEGLIAQVAANVQAIADEMANRENADKAILAKIGEVADGASLASLISNLEQTYSAEKANFALKSEVSASLDTVEAVLASKANAADVYTKEQTLEEITNQLTSYAKQTDLDSYAKLTDLTGKVDAGEYSAYKAQITSELAELTTSVNSKADASNVYTKDEVYTKQEALDKIAEKITEVNGGESAGTVLAQLNSYKETNNARVSALEATSTGLSTNINTLQDTVEELADNVADLDERLDTVEAFFDGAANDSEGLNDALDKLVEIQQFLATEDGTTVGSMLDTIKANSSEIVALKGTNGAMSNSITALDAKIAAIEADYMKAEDDYILTCGTATEVLHSY